MGKIEVSAQGIVPASPDTVYGYVADMREHHPHFLPPAFSDFQVESGGVGAGTIIRYKLAAGGRTREGRMEIGEPEPGRILTESDTSSSLITTWTFEPEGSGARVRISTTWDGAGGIGGFFERLFAPRVLKRIYDDELALLSAYAHEHAPAQEAG